MLNSPVSNVPYLPRGRMLRGGASLAFNLAGEPRVWLVQMGAVDLFLAARSPVGSGVRRHAFRVEAGSVFASVEDCSVDWIAVPTADTQIVELDSTELASIYESDHWATWIRQVATLIIDKRNPVIVIRLDQTGDMTLDGTQLIGGNGSLRWLSVVEGELAVGGMPEVRLTPGMVPFPFSDDLWFTVKPGSRIRIEDAADQFISTRFGHLTTAASIAHCLHDANMLRAEQTKIEWRRSAHREAELLAADSFASVLHRQRRSQPTQSAEKDPLLEAIGIIARHQRITFREPTTLPPAGLPIAVRVTRVLRDSGLLWRRVLLDDAWWRKDVGSFLVIRSSDSAPLVVEPLGRHGYVLFDPTSGERIPVNAATMDILEDKGIFLSRPFPETELTGRKLLSFGLSGRRGDVWAVLLIGLALGIISLLTPLITSSIVGDIIPNAAFNQLGQYTFLLVSMTLSAGLFGLAQALMMVRLSGHLDSTLQGALWDRIMRLPAGFFRSYTAGDLANRAMGINTINSTLTSVTLTAILNGIFASLNFFLMLWYTWKLSLVALLIVLISLLVAFGLTMWQLTWQRRFIDSQGQLTGLVLQLIGGINKLRVAHAEPRAFSVWAAAYSEQNRLNLKAQGLDNALTVFNSMIPTLSAIILFITIAAVLGTISIGNFLAFNAAFTQFFTGVVGLTAAIGNSVNVVPLYRRARPILDALPEVNATKQVPGDLLGRITLDHVSFAYEKNGRPTLDDITLNIAPGEFIAIVGPSGAGKSTLLRLLMGFERPTEGIITYDNKDLEALDVQAVRQQLGVVMQNSQIMPGNIFQNITGNYPDMTAKDAWEAAEMAGLDEDIKAMPMGMETFITEGAATISTGQRQRLMIARAIVRRPRILIFDEATSALDNRTQAIVTASLTRLNATRIVIAQRLSTIVDADRIIVVDRGRIQQSGTYSQLMAEPGLFTDLVTRQLA